MIYALNDLLIKMGAPEVKEKGFLRWHYFDRSEEDVGGFAEVRLLDGGRHLIAEIQYLRRNDDEERTGKQEHSYAESFYLRADRAGAGYKVARISFDGEEYPQPQKSVIELGLSLFHARALDISILMVEQSFNKQDIFRPVAGERSYGRPLQVPARASLRKEAWGIVVPFRPRLA